MTRLGTTRAAIARVAVASVIAAFNRTDLPAQEAVRVTVRPGDSITVRLSDVELRTAVQALIPYLDRSVVIGMLPSVRVSIETPNPVPKSAVARLLAELLDGHGLELSSDSAGSLYRIRPREPVRPVAQSGAPSPAGTRDGSAELFVIRLRHAKASEVAATVNALYGRTSATGDLGGRPTTLARELLEQQTPPSPPPPQAVGSVAGRVATLSGETAIVPDPRANSLLIRASRGDFELIQAAVSQLDIRPLQVLIEVVIAEVRSGRSFDLGLDASIPKTTIAKTENTTIEGVLKSDIGWGDFALRIMGISGLDLATTIRAAESRGDARIINRPVLLAANNERAEINVGSQRPFVQIARVLATDNTARDQVIQYRDVGTRLSIVPTISHEGYVMLQVVQEVNAATEEQQFDAPVISTRSVETRLLVKDGQTIVLGGITDVQHETVSTGVPILSRLPFLGALFAKQSRQRNETELLLFLTPRLVRTDSDADDLTNPLRRRAEKLNP